MTALGVCHPGWRGVRTSAYTFRTPMVETADAAEDAGRILRTARESGLDTIVVHGVPPGTLALLQEAKQDGLATRVVLYSSPAQHGAGKSESDVIDRLLRWQTDGPLDRLGMAKEGVAEALNALGHSVWFVPARIPDVPAVTPNQLEGTLRIGVFAEPFWRKNVVTQLAAVALMPGATAHVMSAPDVDYLRPLTLVEHGELGWSEFLPLLAGVTLNFYVTLSECLPLTPLESYLLGVPCLISQTSALFRSAPDLWELTTVPELDNPRAIAAAGARLLTNSADAVEAARAWMPVWDQYAVSQWDEFIG